MANANMVVVGETLAKIRWAIFCTSEAGVREPVDLTGCTAQAKYSINGGALKTKDLTVVAPATAGKVELQSESDCWDTAGIAMGRIWITSGPRTGKSSHWILEVEAS